MEPTKTQPSAKPSDESTAEQLTLAKGQGRSFDAAVREMTEHEAHGRAARAGDFIVALAVEHAEGLYLLRNGKLQWTEPAEENAHIEVAVRDGADGRFVPNLVVYATVLDDAGREIGRHRQPFLWHPWLYHYGRNWTLPRTGRYTVRVHIDVPEFPRHDKENGRRYTEPVDVEFADVDIETGQKHS